MNKRREKKISNRSKEIFSHLLSFAEYLRRSVHSKKSPNYQLPLLGIGVGNFLTFKMVSKKKKKIVEIKEDFPLDYVTILKNKN